MISRILMAAMVFFSACSNETEDLLQKDEIRLTSEIIPSRVAALDYQSTQIVSGQKVGVTIVGAKEAHFRRKLNLWLDHFWSRSWGRGRFRHYRVIASTSASV